MRKVKLSIFDQPVLLQAGAGAHPTCAPLAKPQTQPSSRGVMGVQRCSPVLIAHFGWQMGSCLAFICALPSSRLYKTRWILTG